MKGKNVMVIGIGSIGSKILTMLLDKEVNSVIAYDNDEEKIFELGRRINDKRITYIYGDIMDNHKLKFAMSNVDIVYHTAAMKLVTVCESNILDAIRINIIGAQNVIDTAIDENIEKLIYISTDKAVNPINVMGATKSLAEKLVLDANKYRKICKTIFSVVRFGNVIGASSSVIPIFEEQIKNNGPVTITDYRMLRYMMTFDDATNLIFKATQLSKGGEIFVFKMKEYNILDLAKEMIGNKDIEIIETGIRKGEKLTEELLTENEREHSIEIGNLIIINPKGEYND